MLNLTDPTFHVDPYVWGAVLLAHAFLGGVAWIALAHVTGRAIVSVQIVAAVYFLLWEVAVQRVGAGLTDALVDTLAVTVGAGLAWSLSVGNIAYRSKVLAILSAVGVAGIWGLS